MKFSVSSSALLSLLATTGKVISNKNTLPILDYFLLELNGNTLQVTTSDLETTLVGQIEVDSVESEGTIAAPAKLMLDSLKEFPELPLTIEVNDKNWEIKINWKSGSLSIPGASAVSYPAVPQLNAEKKELRLDVDTLVNGINKTIFATADDELRPVMNGIYINLAPDALTFVGTDAHKLVKYESEAENEVSASFILPKKPANLLKSVLLKEDDAIEVSFDSKNAMFKLKSHTLVCRLIEGNYPNYNAVIPANNPNKVLVDRIELVNGIKRVAVCSNPTTNLIRMDIGDNRINLTAQDIDFSVSANETITCSYDGEPISIGFKSTFLVEILSNMDTPTVVVELADSTRAGVFKPVYDDKQTLKRPIIFFDLETTGVDTAKDRIVEISMVKVMPDGEQIVKTRKLNPGMHIPAEATAIHGITDEDVRDCPTFAQVAKSLEQFIRGCDFGGFNSNRFDLPVLVEEFLRAGVDVDFKRRKFIDVQNIFHKKEQRTLVAAYKFYCDKDLEEAHSAEADTKATYEVLKAQLDRYDDLENDIDKLAEYSCRAESADYAGRILYNEKGEEVFGFGKYKGRSVAEVFRIEPSYYAWMMNGDFPLYTKKVITEIRMRDKMK